MNIEQLIKQTVVECVHELYGETIQENQVQLNKTRKEFEGHYSVVVFPFTKIARKKPEVIAEDLGTLLVTKLSYLSAYNVVKGFCNLTVNDEYWTAFLNYLTTADDYGKQADKNETVVVEYSSPNTNKPLHLGHIRNNLLGFATANILEENGYNVVKTQVINDRGIHICKSMLAWQRFANGATPESDELKGDHFVGKYYVIFDQAFSKEYGNWQTSEAGQNMLSEWLSGPEAEKQKAVYLKKNKKEIKDGDLTKFFFKEVFKNKYFNELSEMGGAAIKMLEDWEAGDENIVALWKMMNGWVYEGMNKTYKDLGVSFDLNYYESDTYLLGKDIVEKGLKSGAFYQKDDSSVWVDLTDAKLDQKLLLRSNGTSVYMTQDIGMAPVRYEKHNMTKMVYVVGDEQDYHFKVLFEILKRLEEPYAEGLYHLSYGMVELPEGKMKSREGKVVDADDLMSEVIEEVAMESRERETLDGLSLEEQQEIWKNVGLGALKFFMLKIDPRKRMVFDPKKSIDLQGQTGPYVQNAYVRTQAVQRKAAGEVGANSEEHTALETAERDILILLQQYPGYVIEAGKTYNPAMIANFSYELARAYHRFWNDVSILKSEPSAKAFRIKLSKVVANVLKRSMGLLGIEMPNRM